MKTKRPVPFRAAAAILAAFALLLAACPSPVIEGGPDPAQRPTFSVAPGSYTSVQSVEISTASVGASIRYTTDGTDPDQSTGILYEEPVTVAATTTIKAVAFGDGYAVSPIGSGTWTINLPDAYTPTASVPAGTYANSFTVTLTSATADALIYYTTDGTEATDTAGTLYEGPVAIDAACTLRARTYKDGLDPSNPVAWTYAFRVADVTASVAAGTYYAEQTVELSTVTEGAAIWYTTDGTTPAEDSGTSTLYSGAVTVDRSRTIKAIAVKPGYSTTTNTLSRTYTLKVPTPTVDLAAGTYEYPQTATFDPIPGASIRYTLDGTIPTVSTGTLSEGTAAIDGAVKLTLRAIAYRDGWTSSDLSSARSYTVRFPSTRTFCAMRVTDNVWYDSASTRKAVGTYCAVYVENDVAVDTAGAEAIAAEYDANVHGMIDTYFGAPSDVDANGKVILFILDIIDGYAGSGGYIAGYFDPTHEFSKTTYANSNEADMLYLDANPSVPGSAGFHQTVAHEMQHLVDFAQTYLVGKAEKDVWINEGLSSAAEYLYESGHVQDRIDYFNADPTGSIAMGNNFLVWDGYWENTAPYDMLANYSTVYLFFQWLRIHASNGAGIYKEILASSSADYHAVTGPAVSRISSDYNFWYKMLRDWMLANVLASPTGLTGYKAEIAPTAHVLTSTGGASTYLSPGEGIFFSLAAPFDPATASGSNIFHYGVTLATGYLDPAKPYSGDVLLVYNTNGVVAGLDEIAYLPSWAGPMPSLLLSMTGSAPTLPTSWPVGILLAPGGAYREGSGAPNLERPAGSVRPSFRKAP